MKALKLSSLRRKRKTITTKDWREANSDAKGNVRDEATSEQLVVLSNLENLNVEFIKEGFSHVERLQRLNEIAIYQMKLLMSSPASNPLKWLEKGLVYQKSTSTTCVICYILINLKANMRF